MTIPELLSKRVQLAENAQNEKWRLFTDLDEIYHVKGKPQEAEAQMHAPDSWSNVETVAPRMVAKRPTLIFKPRPDPLFQMRDENARSEVSDRQAAIWNYWWDKDDAFTKNVAWVKGALRHGTKMVRTYWKYETQEISDYVYGPDGRPVVGEDGKFQEEQREEVTFDDACMETLSNYDFFIDPEAKDIQSAAWIIFRYRKTLDELKAYGKFTNLKELEGLLTDKTASEHAERSRAISGMGTLEDDSTIERVTCYEMWQKGKKGIEKATVAAKSVTIETWRPNPFRHHRYPFIRLVDSLVDEEFWGKGEIEPVKYFQYALDTYHSLDVANRVQALEQKWKVDGNVDEWELSNGNAIHVNTRLGDDVNPIEVPDYTKTSQPAIELTRSTMSNGLGIYDYAKGGETGPNDTATGITAVQEAANARFNLKIQLYEESLKELGTQIVSLYQQHKTDYFQIEIEDDQGIKTMQTLAPMDIAGSFDIEVESGSSRPANREAERTDALQVYQLTQTVQDPEFQLEALKFVLSKFDGAGQIKDALDGAFARMQQQQQMAQAQQSQMIQAQQGVQQQQVDQQTAQAQQQQAQQQEQGAIDDHKAHIQHFDLQEKKLNDQIAQAEKMQLQKKQLAKAGA